MRIEDILDLDRYPIGRLESAAAQTLVARCMDDLDRDGMFNLEGFLRPAAITQVVAEVRPAMETASFTHKRLHNIYFKREVPGLGADHPALKQVETINHTVCGDQIPGSLIRQVYEWPELAAFLACVMGKAALHPMADELAGANVMAYRAGEALNWHFDRSEFTTTLLLQEPSLGGDFEYRTGLRSDTDPNYEGVARLIEGRDPETRVLKLAAGTLNVFRGKNTAHRVTTVRGGRERMIAVFSYYERPGVMFTAEERLGFYGRTG